MLGCSAAEEAAETSTAAELAHQGLRVDAQLLQQARGLVGVDLLGQLLVGLLGLVVMPWELSSSRIWLLSICTVASFAP